MKVSSFISYHIIASHKTQAEIARDIGLTQPNFISMIKKGTTRIPLNRVPALAESLGISAQNLLLRCLEEYEPDLFDTIQLVLPGAFLLPEEVDIVKDAKARLAAIGARRKKPKASE